MRAHRLREQTASGHPESDTTSGLVAYLDGEPVGWCAVEAAHRVHGTGAQQPRPLGGSRGDKTDDSVWAVTCFCTRAGFRKRVVSRVLAHAGVDFTEVSRPTMRRVVMRIDF